MVARRGMTLDLETQLLDIDRFVAALRRAHEGRPVEATVLRHGQPLSLSLTPQRWSGRGLLGCHLRPL